jgi:hypothetical protein
MGKVRRSGYILEWFIGDHEPRHIHVYNDNAGSSAVWILTGLLALKAGRPTESC